MEKGVNLRERPMPRGDSSPAGSGCPVIYCPEPSPSLTPLLRNYTQSVANKSKKVSAALGSIHGRPAFSLSLSLFLSATSVPFLRDTCVLPPSPPDSCPLPRGVRTFVANLIEILVQIARRTRSRISASRSHEIRPIVYFRLGTLIFIHFRTFMRIKSKYIKF